MILIRPVETHAEVLQLEPLQATIWDQRSVMPYNLLHAMQHTGGIILGAFDGETIIGFVASFQGEVDGQRVQWSHMAAVLPAYRRQGIARQLKFAQREYARRQGIKLIAWTFDPLRRENAVFNFEVLGAESHLLHFELYGEMKDELNLGLLSDRFEVHWHLEDKQVKKLAADQKLPVLTPPETYVTQVQESEPLLQLPACFDSPSYAIEVPSNIEPIRVKSPALAHRWYHALRQTITPLFEAGYSLRRIYCPPERPDVFAYILQRPETWYLYVLETADSTLYTGITNDLDKRIAAHNAGKGATYTLTRRPVKLMAAWRTYGKISAMQLERQFKKSTRPQKLGYVHQQHDFEGATRFY